MTPILPDSYYHIYNRGINRREIFKDDQDYVRFLKLIRRFVLPIGKVVSYALMFNHFHLCVYINPIELIPQQISAKPGALGRTFGHLQNAYATYFNKRYGTVSSLFQHRFKRTEVDSIEYLRNLVVYHHLNPEKHDTGIPFTEYHWTSYQEFSNPVVDTIIDREWVFQKFGGLEAFFGAHHTDTPPDVEGGES